MTKHKNKSGIILFFFSILFFSCNQKNDHAKYENSTTFITEETKSVTSENYPQIVLSHHIKKDTLNIKIVEELQEFLEIKNNNQRSFKYWKKDDFEKYMFPYYDLVNIEFSNRSEGFYYKPTILEIIPLENLDERLVKIAFIGGENGRYLKAIYNIIVDISDFKFKRVLDYNTRNWKTYSVGNINYIISPLKSFNRKAAINFNEFNDKLSVLFDISPKEIDYYSCINPIELFKIKGFDYIQNMYMAKTGGLNEITSNIIFSGNNSESYHHELVHSYLEPKYFKTIYNLQVFSEGLATFLGGSNNKSYLELREELKIMLNKNENLKLANYLDPYYNTQEENQLSYTIGAILCERAIRIKGQKDFLNIFKSKNIEDALNFIGLNQENLQQKLILELEQPPITGSSIL